MSKKQILGVILAGGGSRRFGVDKSVALLAGKPLLQWVVERARPQVDAVVVNANSDIAPPSAIDRIADDWPGEGPLAGILAALRHAGAHDFSHVASFACDTPFFPRNTVARLVEGLYKKQADYAVAHCGEKIHRIFALWPASCRSMLETAFAANARSMSSIENWLTPARADFPPEGGPDGDPFFNINTRDDLATAERWLSARTTE